jgi:hypothetical protein
MLFEIVNKRVVPTVHALMIEPFKSIWEADPTPEKSNAIKLFSYTEFVCSPKKSNPFIGYSEEVRPRKVKKEIYGDENYRTTDFMILCVAKYKEILEEGSPTYVLFNAALNAKDKLVHFLNNFSLEERTNAGTAVIKPADVTRALKEIPDVAKSILASREKVHAELLEDSKTRNQREIRQYED